MDTAEDDQVTIVLQNGSHVTCAVSVLRQHSGYFDALYESGLAESAATEIQLLHLDSPATTAILNHMHDTINQQLGFWNDFDWNNEQDVASLVQVADYLQIQGSDLSDPFYRSIAILSNPDIVRSECAAKGLLAETGQVLQIPIGKKKRAWRFWVCFLLCLDLMPEEGVRMDQAAFTEILGPVGASCGGAVSLRRELVEYGLVQREGDGSAYWRPAYTVSMLRGWIQGRQRNVI
jgi:hypothetical protein